MNAAPPPMTRPSPAGRSRASASGKWIALHEAANVIAAMAGLGHGPETAVLDFRLLMRDAAPWRRELAERAIDDAAAAIGPGLSALVCIESRGLDPGRPARALWREFTEARAAILRLSLAAAA